MAREKISLFFKNKKHIAIICACIGLLLIAVSSLGGKAKPTSESEEEKLEKRLENIISTACGGTSVDVMITMEDTEIIEDSGTMTGLFSDNTSSLNKAKSIAGVMIVCKNISNPDDLSTIKKASATTLDIPQSKIYIIGGKAAK